METFPPASMSLRQQAGVLAEQLAKARVTVEEALTTLERLASSPVCLAGEVARARWRLEVADRARLSIAQEAVAFIAVNSFSSVSVAIDRWTEAQARLQNYLRSYKDRWTLQSFQADWEGYRQAFAEKRALLSASLLRDRDCLESVLLSLVVAAEDRRLMRPPLSITLAE